ncbi:FCN2-like protein [Mya arenaria]|uniref:FCN2-like protein n=1 Tax=Mya arenaria TaxID=6604 RepID=A0ABY7G7T0_MYAAR|nr:FCN2-like protein [Mya arenaria]
MQLSASSPLSPASFDCSEVRQNLGRVPSGVYHITTWKTNQIASVFCDMDTDQGGWTVFQHRMNGNVDFYRNFSSYENGFGSLQGEFWFGLKLMYEMTSRTSNDLRIDITRGSGSTGYIVYADFSVGAGSNYTLHVGNIRSKSGRLKLMNEMTSRTSNDLRIDITHSSGYTGYIVYADFNVGAGSNYTLHVGNTLSERGGFNTYNNCSAFSTFDHDNDLSSSSNCAVILHGGWWYNDCIYCANLNGHYHTPGTYVLNKTAMTFDGYQSLKTSKMIVY